MDWTCKKTQVVDVRLLGWTYAKSLVVVNRNLELFGTCSVIYLTLSLYLYLIYFFHCLFSIFNYFLKLTFLKSSTFLKYFWNLNITIHTPLLSLESFFQHFPFMTATNTFMQFHQYHPCFVISQTPLHWWTTSNFWKFSCHLGVVRWHLIAFFLIFFI